MQHPTPWTVTHESCEDLLREVKGFCLSGECPLLPVLAPLVSDYSDVHEVRRYKTQPDSTGGWVEFTWHVKCARCRGHELVAARFDRSGCTVHRSWRTLMRLADKWEEVRRYGNADCHYNDEMRYGNADDHYDDEICLEAREDYPDPLRLIGFRGIIWLPRDGHAAPNQASRCSGADFVAVRACLDAFVDATADPASH